MTQMFIPIPVEDDGNLVLSFSEHIQTTADGPARLILVPYLLHETACIILVLLVKCVIFCLCNGYLALNFLFAKKIDALRD